MKVCILILVLVFFGCEVKDTSGDGLVDKHNPSTEGTQSTYLINEAIYANNVQRVADLVQDGANINGLIGDFTPLMLAVEINAQSEMI